MSENMSEITPMCNHYQRAFALYLPGFCGLLLIVLLLYILDLRVTLSDEAAEMKIKKKKKKNLKVRLQ